MTVPLRAALCPRVSTARQAEHDAVCQRPGGLHRGMRCAAFARDAAKRAEALKARHAVSKSRAKETGPVHGRATMCGTTGPAIPKPPKRATAAKAAASKTNRGTGERGGEAGSRRTGG